MPHQFTYPNFSGDSIQDEGLADYATHSGQLVTVLEEIENAFEDGDGNACRGYRVRAADGWEGIIWPGELSDPLQIHVNQKRRLVELVSAFKPPSTNEEAPMTNVNKPRFCIDMKEDTEDENWTGVNAPVREGKVYAVFDKLNQQELIVNVSYTHALAIVLLLNND